MASPGWGPNDNPLLSGLFGVLQSAAASRQSTADIWSGLRVAAATWQWQAQGGGEIPSQAELEATGADILRSQGVGIQQVNAYRAIAGQWRSAHEKAQALENDEQVMAGAIFRPPWAQTAPAGVPVRYRVRVNWELTPAVGDIFNKWSTYELTAPITTIGDVLGQAGSKAAGDRYLYQLSGGSPPSISDYEIEQI